MRGVRRVILPRPGRKTPAEFEALYYQQAAVA